MSKLDFSVSTNPLVLPLRVYYDLSERFVTLISRYVPPHDSTGHRVLADFLGVPAESLSVCCGASEAIFTLPRVLKARSGVVFSPAFWEYRASLEASEAKVVAVARRYLDGFTLTEDILDRMGAADVGFMSNPDNPTSILSSRERLLSLAHRLRGGALIVDETYLLFRSDFKELSMMEFAVSNENVVVVGSLSKFFNVPGLRIGYVISHPVRAQAIRERLAPFSVNNIALLVMERMLHESEFIEESRRMLAVERQWLVEGIRGMGGCSVIPPEANFVLVRIRDGCGITLRESLDQAGIVVRWGVDLDSLGPDYFRAAVRTREENSVLVEKLGEYCTGLVE